MNHFLKALSLIAVFAGAPAFAQTADQPAADHPKAPAAGSTAKPDAKPSDVAGCPGANGQMMGGQAMADHMKDHMAGGQMSGSQGQGMMGGPAGGQGMGMGSSGMMAGAQNPNCPGAGKTPAEPKK
jgi:hypothetical protein